MRKIGKFSVKAVLSAVDKNFTSTMKSAMGYTSDLKRTLTSGIGFGAMMAVGQKAVSVVGNGVTGLIGDMNSASAAWKTFKGNLSMNGKAVSDIKAIKGELQDFATDTIYSASDMASTYAQLEAVGTKNTTKLVKGFGGLAAAAESPKQAMKTLSQQATQMAAKPMVAWEDFKLMLEQTPAGMAAVAKEMGMTTTDLIKNIQEGTLATEDFFDAIAKVGTNDAFTKLATEYKTVDQAMDGLQETVGVKLGPSFEVMSDIGIRAVSKLIDAMDGIDGTALATKLSSTLDRANGYWQVFKENVVEVKNAFGDAISAIGTEMGKLNGAFGSTESISAFSNVMEIASGALVAFAGFLERHADVIAQVLPWIPKLLIAYQGFMILRTIAPFVTTFSKGILMLAGKGVGAIAGKLFGISKSQKQVGTASMTSSKQMLQSATAFLALGAGVALVSAGFALLSYSAIQLAGAGPLAIGVLAGMVVAIAGLMVVAKSVGPALTAGAVGLVAFGAAVLIAGAGMAVMTAASISLANAGPLAIGVMVGMVAAIALLAAGAALLGPMLTAGAIGFIAFGAAIVLVGSGALLASTALAVVASVLPIVSAYGVQGAAAIALLGVGMVAFAAGAALAGAGCIVLGAGLLVVAAGLTLVGAAVLIAATGVLLLAAGAIALGTGLTLCATALMVTGSALPLVATGAASSAAAFALLVASATALSVLLVAVSAAMIALGVSGTASAIGVAAFALAMTTGAAGTLAMSVALKAVNSSMKSIAKNAKSAENSLDSMRSSVDVVTSGLDAVGNKAKSAMKALINAFDNAANKATRSGQAVGKNFNTGLNTGMVLATATATSSSSNIVVVLNSAQSGAYSAGVNIGAGLANGMRSMVGAAWAAAAELAAAAEAAIRAKAQIHSPSRVSDKLAMYYGKGWINRLRDMASEAWKAAEELVSIPEVPNVGEMHLAYAGSGHQIELREDYDYRENATYTMVVHSELEGREIARASATYTKEELEKKEKLNKYMKGYK